MNNTLLETASSKRNDPLTVPHRLETAEDITQAMIHDVLRLGTNAYLKLLDFQKNGLIIRKPSVLLSARPVSRDFFVLKERKVRELHESYRRAEGLSSISNYDLIRDQIPGMDELIDPAYLTSCSEAFNCRLEHKRLRGRAYTLKRYILLKDIIAREIRSMMHRKTTRYMTVAELKRLIIALTLHDNRNKDVMQAVKIAQVMDDDILRGNALTELYLARVPRFVKSLFIDDPKITIIMRQKLLSRISRHAMPANLKIALFHMAPRTNTRRKEDFITMAERLCSYIEKTQVLERKSKTSITSFIQNVIGELRDVKSIYERLFLPGKELKNLFRLYVPNTKLVTCSMSQKERIIREHCNMQTLFMYPCKDFLDVEKYRWSGDCTSASLGLRQVAAHQFFNVRLFKDNRDYCGNIYMLQTECDSRMYLLVDHIQTSRFDEKYTMFFKTLKDAFIEMFEDVPYYQILVPNSSISNNRSLNHIFHSTKAEFPRKRICLGASDFESALFESLRGDTFRVLCEKKS